MNWQRNIELSGVLVLAVLLTGGADSQSREKTKVAEALDEVVANFDFADMGVEEFLSKINKFSRVPVNAEIVAHETLRHTVSMRDGRVRDILTKYTQAANLEWQESGGGITIIERCLGDEPSSVMTSDLASFDKEGKDKFEAAMQLFSHPSILEKNFYVISVKIKREGSSKSPVIYLHLEDVSPREILGAIVEADGQSYWVLTSNPDGSRYLSFGKRAQYANGALVDDKNAQE